MEGSTDEHIGLKGTHIIKTDQDKAALTLLFLRMIILVTFTIMIRFRRWNNSYHKNRTSLEKCP